MTEAIRLGMWRSGIELRAFFRERDAVVFTFALPVVLLALLGSAFRHPVAGGQVTGSQLFTAGMIAGGIGSTTFLSLGVGIAVDRDSGTLKRLRGMPLPPAAYFLGRIALALVLTVAEIALLLAVGWVAFGVQLPADAGHWLTFAWLAVLGVTSC